MNKTRIICISGMVIALYVVTMFVTQGFAFYAAQIRIATALYSLSYVFPFLVFPLALANMLSNFLFGTLGLPDVLGGFAVGFVTAGLVYCVKKFNLPRRFIIPIIIFGPALIVPIWLSILIDVPYMVLVSSLLIGQAIPAIAGYFLTFEMERITKYEFFTFGKAK